MTCATVTGGGRGIGRAIALGYARAGADVVLSAEIVVAPALQPAVTGRSGQRILATEWNEPG